MVKIEAKNKYERSQISEIGISLDEINDSYIIGTATPSELKKLKRTKLPFQSYSLENYLLDFPPADSAYHNYDEMLNFLKLLAEKYPKITELISIGKSLEGRDIWALHITAPTPPEFDKPAIAFFGAHHAREHLSVEVPIYLANYLLEQSEKPDIRDLILKRDIWIIPMVNPDGTEFDINPSYQSWRKNRKKNDNGSFGVDLNRNYGFQWGKRGASSDPNSETYRGKAPFSEPETQVTRDFLLAHKNIKSLVTYHSFSELILYPWGYTYNPIENPKDLNAFETMAQSMAKFTGYKPEPGSDLYLVSGEMCDWAYGELGIFAFTIELSPKSSFEGGFYPGNIIEKTVDVNIDAALYMIEKAGHPYTPTTFVIPALN